MTIEGHINSGPENNILSLQAGNVPQGEFSMFLISTTQRTD